MSQLSIRSRRTRRPAQVFTPSRTQLCVENKSENIHTKSYALNKKKALKKKIEASDREFSVVAIVKKGNLVIECDAGLFEVFKIELYRYFNDPSCTKVHSITKTIDEEGLTVEENISVKLANQKRQLYKINLYNTTSRILVNGSQFLEFVKVDLPKVLETLDQNPLLKEINESIRSACLAGLSQLETPVNHNIGHDTQPDENWGISSPKLNKLSISDISYNELTEDLQCDHIRGPPLDSQSVSENPDVPCVEMCSLSVNTSPIAIDLLQDTNSDIFSNDNQILLSPTISELAKDNDDTLIYESHGTDVTISEPRNARQSHCNVNQPLYAASTLPTIDNSELTILEQQLKKKEKELEKWEKELKEREYDQKAVAKQLALSRSKILALEKTVTDLDHSNRLLKSRFLIEQNKNQENHSNETSLNTSSLNQDHTCKSSQYSAGQQNNNCQNSGTQTQKLLDTQMEFLRMQATQSERQYEFMSRICSLEVEKVTMKHEIEKINNKLLSSNNFNLQNVAQQNVHQAQPHMSQHYNMRKPPTTVPVLHPQQFAPTLGTSVIRPYFVHVPQGQPGPAQVFQMHTNQNVGPTTRNQSQFNSTYNNNNLRQQGTHVEAKAHRKKQETNLKISQNMSERAEPVSINNFQNNPLVSAVDAECETLPTHHFLEKGQTSNHPPRTTGTSVNN